MAALDTISRRLVSIVRAALVLALPFYWHRNLTTSSIPEKSIAVLPFENFSDNKENSYFAAGIQDDVLTSVGKIKDLKVIAPGSVMDYRGGRGPGKLREIEPGVGRLSRAARQCAEDLLIAWP